MQITGEKPFRAAVAMSDHLHMERELKEINEYGIDAIHAVELDMLKAVAHLCEEHGLRYSIYCGTLLGAVRHKGFIPWDDDVDIAMPLKDFRRFKKVAHELPERFSCICFDNTPDSIWPWIRVVADGTACIPLEYAKLNVPWGFSLDIYPMIGAADTKLGQKLQNILLFAARRLQFVSVYRARQDKGIVKRILYCIPYPVLKALSGFILRIAMRDPEKSRRVGTVDALRFEGKFDREDWKEMTRLPFENAEFSAPTAYDKILRTMYGEYMTPPAPSHRVPHFLKDKKYIVDPGRDYRLYLQELNKE